MATILSAFLLSRTYPLIAINLEESAEQVVAAIRIKWLDFCDRSGMPVPESNPVMITISSAVYDLLLEQAEIFQRNLSDNGESASTSQHLLVVKVVKMCTFELVVQLFAKCYTCITNK